MPNPLIAFRTSPAGHLCVSAQGFLDRETLAEFCNACRKYGLTFDGSAYTGPLAVATALQDELQALHFPLDVSNALRPPRSLLAGDFKWANGDPQAPVTPAGLVLDPHQVQAIKWVQKRASMGKGSLLAACTSSGKTPMSLCAAPKDAPILIVCPGGLTSTWKVEVEKWRPDLKPRILKADKNALDGNPIGGVDKHRHVIKGHWPAAGEAWILSDSLLPQFIYSKPNKGTWVISDETHRYSSNKSLRHNRFRPFRNTVYQVGGIVLGLTATPAVNTPKGLYHVLEICGVEKEAFGPRFASFAALFGGDALDMGGWQWDETKIKPSAAAALAKVCLVQRKEDLQPELLAKRRIRDIYVPIPESAKVYYDSILQKLKAAGISIERAIEGIANNDPEFHEYSNVRKHLATVKIPFLLEFVEKEDKRAWLAFSAHREPVEALGLEGWGVIHGGISLKKRDEVRQALQAGELNRVALTIQTGGEGLTLTAASCVVVVDLPWTDKDVQQLEGRVIRRGQQADEVWFYRLIVDHELEKRIHECVSRKRSMANAMGL